MGQKKWLESTKLRIAAFIVITALLGATIAISLISLRRSTDFRLQLSGLDSSITLLSQQTGSQIDGLSRDLRDLSQGMEKEMASSRRVTAGDVARMGRGLSGRLDIMTRQLQDLAPSPRPESPAGTAAAEPAQIAEHRLQASAALPQKSPAEPQQVDQDLDMQHRMKEGMSVFESGKYLQAREVFRSALAEHPTDSAARLYYAVSAFRANPADATSFALVERNLRSVLSSDNENLLALETLAMIEAEQRKWPAALENLGKLIALRPGVPRYLKTAGSCALMEGDVQSARDWFDRAAIQAPADAEAWSSLGDCESRLGKPVDAEKAWKSSLSHLDLGTAGGRREGLELSVKLAKSAYERGAYDDTLEFARRGKGLGTSALLRAYEGLGLAATGSGQEGRAILEPIASSSDAQAAALARSGLQGTP